MYNNKTFCIAPWVQTVLRTDGSLGPCCLAQSPMSIKKTSIKEYYTSEWTQNLKKTMLNGNPSSVCSRCYNDEKNNGTSMRTILNEDYKFHIPKYYKKTLDYFNLTSSTYPKRLELHISNLCNLKCLTCNPGDSSAILTEDKIIKVSNYNASEFTRNELILETILNGIMTEDIETIDLRGGESMLVPKIKEFLKHFDIKLAKKITLRIQTNATIFDNEWSDILSRFNRVEFMLSIDAYSNDNTYIRYPADWALIINTIKNIKLLNNASIYINNTVSNLNLLVLPKFIDWVIQENLSCVFAPIYDPVYFKITNLPINLLKTARNNLLQYKGAFNYKRSNDQLLRIINDIDAALLLPQDQSLWEEFCKIISIRDTYRKNSIFNVIPELKDHWIYAENS